MVAGDPSAGAAGAPQVAAAGEAGEAGAGVAGAGVAGLAAAGAAPHDGDARTVVPGLAGAPHAGDWVPPVGGKVEPECGVSQLGAPASDEAGDTGGAEAPAAPALQAADGGAEAIVGLAAGAAVAAAPGIGVAGRTGASFPFLPFFARKAATPFDLRRRVSR